MDAGGWIGREKERGVWRQGIVRHGVRLQEMIDQVPRFSCPSLSPSTNMLQEVQVQLIDTAACNALYHIDLDLQNGRDPIKPDM